MLLLKKPIIWSLALLLSLSLLSALIGVAYWKNLLSKPIYNQGEKVYELKSGSSVNQVLVELEQQQVISEVWPIKVLIKLYPEQGLIKAGEYLIPSGINSYQLLTLLSSGQSIQYQITLVEGWTFAQVLKLIQQHPKLDIKTQALTNTEIMTKISGLPPAQVPHPEGQIFPDTYQFQKGVTDLELLTWAYKKMQRVLEEEWEKADQKALPYRSAYEALIMASIVEKETAIAAERARIAGVFVQRLEKNMRLQTDPTVIYGLGDRYLGNITRRHLNEKTPYNTYRINGLPPTPIALAGREAIHAALHPLKEGDLYFVAKGDGSHVFNRSLEAHNRAVRHYQINQRRKNYQSSPEFKVPTEILDNSSQPLQ